MSDYDLTNDILKAAAPFLYGCFDDGWHDIHSEDLETLRDMLIEGMGNHAEDIIDQFNSLATLLAATKADINLNGATLCSIKVEGGNCVGIYPPAIFQVGGVPTICFGSATKVALSQDPGSLKVGNLTGSLRYQSMQGYTLFSVEFESESEGNTFTIPMRTTRDRVVELREMEKAFKKGDPLITEMLSPFGSGGTAFKKLAELGEGSEWEIVGIKLNDRMDFGDVNFDLLINHQNRQVSVTNNAAIRRQIQPLYDAGSPIEDISKIFEGGKLLIGSIAFDKAGKARVEASVQPKTRERKYKFTSSSSSASTPVSPKPKKAFVSGLVKVDEEISF